MGFVKKRIQGVHGYAGYRHVHNALKSRMKGVQANEGDVDADNIDELVEQVRGEQEQRYLEKRNEEPAKRKVRIDICQISLANCHPRLRIGQGEGRRRIRRVRRLHDDGRRPRRLRFR